MVVSLVLIEGKDVNEEALRSLSLSNALQLVIGNASGFGTILDIRADSSAYLGQALLDFANVPGVTGVITLAIRSEQ